MERLMLHPIDSLRAAAAPRPDLLLAMLSASLRSAALCAAACVGLTASHVAAEQQPAPAPAPQAASSAPASAAAAAAPAAPSAAPPAPAPTAAPAAPRDQGSDSFDLARALAEGSEAMTADQVAALAVKTAPSMAKAEAVNEQARKAASQAMVAVYPRVDFTAQYTRLSPPPTVHIKIPFPNPAMPQDVTLQKPVVDQYLLQARVSYPVSDLFFAILPRYRAAQENIKAQELNERAQAQTVALQAREAFYNYARARAALMVARSGLAQAEAQMHDVESLVHAGTLARVEHMRAQAQVAAARVAVARSQGSVAVARTALRSLLHRDGEQDIAVAEDLSSPLPALTENKDQLLQSAFHNRSELHALETMTGVQAHNIDAANANKLPKFSIAGSSELGNPNQRATSYAHHWTGTWELMAMLTWSPNDFAVGNASADQVRAQRAQTLADMEALEDALRREVSQSYEDYQAAREAMDAAQVGINAAEESYRVRREQFRAGAAVATDVVMAEGDLNRARLDLVNAAIDLRIAHARLQRAVERGQQS
jgi:outer membrane protein